MKEDEVSEVVKTNATVNTQAMTSFKAQGIGFPNWNLSTRQVAQGWVLSQVVVVVVVVVVVYFIYLK